MLPSNRCKPVAAVAASALLACWGAQADIIDTIQAAKSGQTVYVSGTYSVNRPCYVPGGVTVSGPATFNFNNAANGFVPNGNNVKLNSISVTGVNNPGIYIYGRSGCVINSCNAYGNKNTGIQIQGSGAVNNTVQYCQGYNNVDTATSGENADGFACKFGTGSGNVFKNCKATGNADDGWDLWQAGAPVTLTSCTSYSNGKLSAGDGNGFKLGSSGMNIAHQITSCIAYSNRGESGRGFTQNGNTGNCRLTNCRSYSNQRADVLNNCTLVNCTMQQ
jgi:parallel beta-helix repeat protein